MGVCSANWSIAAGSNRFLFLTFQAKAADESWLAGCETVGLTSGASAPERLVADVCAWFRERGAEVCEQKPVHEDVSFKLPVELRRAERAAA